MAIDPERANRWNEPRRAGLHLRSSPRRSWRVRRATRARAACCSGQTRERSKAHFRVWWASPSLQARPFADCAAAPATIPTTPTPRSPSRRLITLFSCIRPDVPIRTLECPIGCLYPSTSAAPSGMKTAPKCAPGKRKEQQQQITESERNVIASNIRPRQGHHSPATGRDHIHCDSVCHHRFYV